MKYVVIFCFRYCNKHEYSKRDKFLWVCLVVFHLIFDKKTGCCIKINVRKVSCRIGQTHSPNTSHQRSCNFVFLCFYYARLVCILLAAQHTHSIFTAQLHSWFQWSIFSLTNRYNREWCFHFLNIYKWYITIGIKIDK